MAGPTNAHGASCAGPEVHRDIAAQADDLVMRARERRVQKSMRVEDGKRGRHEHVLHDLEAGFGGAGSVGVAAHAVEYQHQRRFFRNDNGSAVLVVLAVAERGDLCVFDLHGFACGYRLRRKLRMSGLGKT